MTITAAAPASSAYITPDQVCELIPGMTKAILAQLRFKGTGPRYYKPSAKTVIYSLDEVLAWVESTARTGTAEGA